MADSGVQDCYVEGCQGNPGWAIELKTGARGNWITNNVVTTSNRGIGTANDADGVPDEDEDTIPDYGIHNTRIVGNYAFNNITTGYHMGGLQNSVFSNNISDGFEVTPNGNGITFSTYCKNITGTGNLVRNIATGSNAIGFASTSNIHIEVALENVPEGCIIAHTSAEDHVVVVTQLIDGPSPKLLWDDPVLANSRNSRIYLAGKGYNLGWQNVASAATVELEDTVSELVRITGTTGVTSFGAGEEGMYRRLRFSSACLLTHSSTLLLPGGNNLTTTANDEFDAYVTETADTWKLTPLGQGLIRTQQDQNVTGGWRNTSLSLGSSSTTGFTLDPGDARTQRYLNNGAHTLTAGTQPGLITLKITNDPATPGIITLSGFTYVTGDAFDVNVDSVFLCDYYQDNLIATLHVVKLA
jgi:hypothetical protein